MASVLVDYDGPLAELANLIKRRLRQRGFAVRVSDGGQDGFFLQGEKRPAWRRLLGLARVVSVDLVPDLDDPRLIAAEIRLRGLLLALPPLAVGVLLAAGLAVLLGWPWLLPLLLLVHAGAVGAGLLTGQAVCRLVREHSLAPGEAMEEADEAEDEDEDEENEERPRPRPRVKDPPRRENLTARWPAGSRRPATSREKLESARGELERLKQQGKVTPEEYERRAGEMIISIQIQDKLDELEMWRRSGLITPAEYEDKKREIMSQAQRRR